MGPSGAETRLLVDGDFVDAANGRTFATHTPIDGSVLLFTLGAAVLFLLVASIGRGHS